MALEQPLEMGDEPDDRLVGELSEGQLAEAVLAAFARDADKQIHDLDAAAGELVLQLRWIFTQKNLDIRIL
jgi:hypothetical protein